MTRLITLAALTLTATLAACGGGGGGSSSPSAGGSSSSSSSGGATGSVEGMWTGTTSQGRSFSGVVLADKRYFLVYSAASVPNSIAGFLQGSLSTNANTFTSVDAKDFNIEGYGVNSTSVTGSFTARTTLNATIASNSATLSGSYLKAYETPLTLASLAGFYSGAAGSSAGAQNSTLTLQSSGVFDGVISGCNYTGKLSLATTTYGQGPVLNVSVTFNGGTCTFGTQTLTGVAFVKDNILYATVPNAARSDGFVFAGVR